MNSIKWYTYKDNFDLVNGFCCALLALHIISFIWTLTRCLYLKYTPEQLAENSDDFKPLTDA